MSDIDNLYSTRELIFKQLSSGDYSVRLCTLSGKEKHSANGCLWDEFLIEYRLDYLQIKAQDVLVGDLVWLRENDEIPCDLVLLGTSEPLGICQIEVSFSGWLEFYRYDLIF